MYIPLNVAPYSPNTINGGSPKQATKEQGRGFFSAPNRSTGGRLVRSVSSTFADVWSQPRLFFNSLLPVEQQFVVNAIRFETSQLTSSIVKNNVLIQLNRVSHEVAVRVAEALDMKAPAADSKYYHNNKTTGVSVSKDPLLKIEGLKVGFLTSNAALGDTAASIKSKLSEAKVGVSVVAERLGKGVDQTYSATFAGQFDAIVVDGGAAGLFAPSGSLAHSNATLAQGNSTKSAPSTLFPAGRPLNILQDGYNWGKPVAVIGSGSAALQTAGIEKDTPGVYAASDVDALVKSLSEGLHTFKFLDRYPLDG